MKTKLFHGSYADDDSNSCVKPSVDIPAKDVISKLALEVCNRSTYISKTLQLRVSLAHIRQEVPVGHLDEGGTTV